MILDSKFETNEDGNIVHKVKVGPDLRTKKEYDEWVVNVVLPSLFSKGETILIIQDCGGNFELS